MNGWSKRCKRSKCRDKPFYRWYERCPHCGRKIKGLTPKQKYDRMKSMTEPVTRSEVETKAKVTFGPRLI